MMPFLLFRGMLLLFRSTHLALLRSRFHEFSGCVMGTTLLPPRPEIQPQTAGDLFGDCAEGAVAGVFFGGEVGILGIEFVVADGGGRRAAEGGGRRGRRYGW